MLPSHLGIGDDDIYWTWLQCDQYSVFDTFHCHFITIQVSNNNIFGVKAAISKILFTQNDIGATFKTHFAGFSESNIESDST